MGKWLSSVKGCLTYWRGLLTEALARSEQIGSTGGKLWKILLAIAFPLATSVAGVPLNFTLREWIWCPISAFLLWLVILMLVQAYRKHAEQERVIGAFEAAKAVKLSVERITCQHDVQQGLDICRVTIRNLSTMTPAENVHVRMSGDVIPKIFSAGYSPFYEPDLLPASGCRTINPNAEGDWIFPKPFNSLVTEILRRGTFFTALVGEQIARSSVDLRQRFTVSASASSSPPAIAEFAIDGNKSTREIIFERNPPPLKSQQQTSP